MAKSARDKTLLANAFRSVKRYPPPRVEAVRKRSGEDAARRMETRIALDEARKKGVKV